MIPQRDFYFVRHGQTDQNVQEGLITKTNLGDISLNAVGKRQATALQPLISALPIRSICFSPLIRAVETKELLANGLDADHHAMPNLGECTASIWFEMTKGQNKALSEFSEPVQQFLNRVARGLKEALEKPGPALIVAHGGVHWAICYFLRADHSWLVQNCVPIHFSPDAKGIWQTKPLIDVDTETVQR